MPCNDGDSLLQGRTVQAVMAERIAETDLHGHGIKQESIWIWLHFITSHSGYSANNNKTRGSAHRRLLSVAFPQQIFICLHAYHLSRIAG